MPSIVPANDDGRVLGRASECGNTTHHKLKVYVRTGTSTWVVSVTTVSTRDIISGEDSLSRWAASQLHRSVKTRHKA